MKVWIGKSRYGPSGYLIFFENPMESISMQPSSIHWNQTIVIASEAKIELPEKPEKFVEFLLEAKQCPMK